MSQGAVSLSWGDVIDAQADGRPSGEIIAEWMGSLPFPQWAALHREAAYVREMADLGVIRNAVIADILDRSLSPRWEYDTGRWPKEPDDDVCPTCGYSRY